MILIVSNYEDCAIADKDTQINDAINKSTYYP
jgi:hypothetical protein